jgi:S-DNA-T family DNA segregation ATPase FtsK/SpoIIIE
MGTFVLMVVFSVQEVLSSMAARQNTHNKSNAQKKKSSVKKNPKTQSRTQNKVPDNRVVQEEIILVIVMVISVILFLSNFNLSGKVGAYISSFAFGMIGILAYIFPFFIFFATAFCLSNFGNREASGKILGVCVLFIALAGLAQLITTPFISAMTLSDYYTSSSEFHKGGGMIGGILVKLFCNLFDTVVTYIILISIILISAILISGKAMISCMAKKRRALLEERKALQKERMEELQTLDGDIQNDNDRRPPKTFVLDTENGTKDNKNSGEKSDHHKNDGIIPINSLKNKRKKKEKIAAVSEETPKVVNLDYLFQNKEDGEMNNQFDQGASYTNQVTVPSSYEEELETKFGKQNHETGVELPECNEIHNETPVVSQNAGEKVEAGDSAMEDKVEKETTVNQKENEKKDSTHNCAGQNEKSNASTDADQLPIDQEPRQLPYVFPPVNLLSAPKVKTNKAAIERHLKETAIKLQSTLDSFGVHVTIMNVSCGPAVTRYELQPEQGVKVSRITSLTDDIKLNLAAADIRIEAPIPGKAAVGIEVPNKDNSTVALREMLESNEFTQHPSDIAFAVGKDIGGQTIVTDIAKMPHLLIAGATGSGKSVCINTLVMSILYKANPADVRLIMVDPKVVELSVYNGIPHLLIPVVTDPKKASAALNWAVVEMQERYKKFADAGVRDLKGYNEKVSGVADLNDDHYQKMPQIVIIIDELADLMMVAPGEVEDAICRLAQMARAAGLHLIIATQRPSVNVITGLIKANIPSRIAFAVSSAVDSRTILDGSGAEKLLGKGDMLFFPSGYPKPVRIQGAFISDKEVSAVVDFLKNNNAETQYSEEIKDQIANAKTADSSPGGASDRDDYFMEAGKFIIEKDKASIGMLQRVYKIGFNRAARIMDQLSEAGVVGPEEGTKPRKVLMTAEEFEKYMEDN